jgi:hypothetical protein
MAHQIVYPACRDILEYHGNTVVELTRRQGEATLLHRWLLFDSVSEAQTFFNEHLERREWDA